MAQLSHAVYMVLVISILLSACGSRGVPLPFASARPRMHGTATLLMKKLVLRHLLNAASMHRAPEIHDIVLEAFNVVYSPP
jgi:hypothetical protein